MEVTIHRVVNTKFPQGAHKDNQMILDALNTFLELDAKYGMSLVRQLLEFDVATLAWRRVPE